MDIFTHFFFFSAEFPLNKFPEVRNTESIGMHIFHISQVILSFCFTNGLKQITVHQKCISSGVLNLGSTGCYHLKK